MNTVEDIGAFLRADPQYDAIVAADVVAILDVLIEDMAGPNLGRCQGPQCAREMYRDDYCGAHLRQVREGEPLTPIVEPGHGDDRMYQRGCRCALCREEHARVLKVYAEERYRKAAAGSEEVPHGSSGYRNWGCRCPICKKAGAEWNKQTRERHKQRQEARQWA